MDERGKLRGHVERRRTGRKAWGSRVERRRTGEESSKR